MATQLHAGEFKNELNNNLISHFLHFRSFSFQEFARGSPAQPPEMVSEMQCEAPTLAQWPRFWKLNKVLQNSLARPYAEVLFGLPRLGQIESANLAKKLTSKIGQFCEETTALL